MWKGKGREMLIYFNQQSHKDGPLYFPRVAILSLSGPAVIEFRKELSLPPSLSLYLHPRSLLIFQDEAYTEYLSERVFLIIFIFIF
jgi:hypothetical protein